MTDLPSHKRFEERFLSRRRFRVVVVATLAAAVAIGAVERSTGASKYATGWVLLPLFLFAYAISLRKWSMKLRSVREVGMWNADARRDLRTVRRSERERLALKRRADLAGCRVFRRDDLVKIVRRRRADRRALERHCAMHRHRLAAAIHADLDRLWTELNRINLEIAEGKLDSPAEILEHANQRLAAANVQGIRRVEVVEQKDEKGVASRVVVAHHREPFGRLEAWLELHAAIGTVAALGVLPHARIVSVGEALRDPMAALSLLVLLSGLVGLVLFRFAPERLARRETAIPFEEASTLLGDFGTALRAVERRLPESTRAHLARFLSGDLHGRAAEIRAAIQQEPAELQASVRDVVVLAGTRTALRRASAPSRRIDLLLRVWRWVHVPLSVVLLALLLQHVVREVLH